MMHPHFLHRRFSYSRCFALAIGLTWAQQGATQEPLRLMFENRAPYAYKNKQGKLDGLIVQSLEPALKKAGIDFVWIETPFKRQLSIVEQDQDTSCATGVFMTKERQRYAKFSGAILHDQERPSIILAHQDFKIPPGLNLLQVLSLSKARLLKKEHASYGPHIDDAIEKSGIQIVSTTAESRNMAKMLVAKRGDFIFVSEEEARTLIKENADGAHLQIYTPSGMPQSQDRYLMCTNKTADQTLQRLNRALSPNL
ncbi:transporter substrate-binding domain-containing protein [Undibacterium cyanobacteriorum]|uniref:Transporter substrate-binding domain-containing protein n=1 Tax=Undibacterium cyanobacteriorum TaxID=3073561 RepID=A0ABY9RKF7_9BURK|nr:transporter substrate-binding domain-containing protein [Undibacterium sp. 20NA77.5]WMW80531.1 transporter substrate-binding domain-containing protein [Undibacterium sp. 20NA77.5]